MRDKVKRQWRGGVDKIMTMWEQNPLVVIGIGIAALTAASKLVDSVSSIQSKRAYAKRMTYPNYSRRVPR